MATKTFPITACLPVIYANGDGVNAGDSHIPLGRWAAGTGQDWITRCLLKASISFTGMVAINEARLYLYQHTGGSWHAKGSGSVTVATRRKTVDWSESSGGSSTATDEIWGGDSGSLVSSGFFDDSDASGSINNGAADGALDYVPITNIVRAWHAGSAQYGLMVFALSSAESGACELYSRRASGRVPYIWIDYSTNTPPEEPSGLVPGASLTYHTGRTITYSATRQDPDGSADGMVAGEISLRTDGGSVIDGWTWTQSGGTTFAQTRTLPAGHEAGGPFYEWRARTKDEAGAWGPWSGWARFQPNSVPTTPAAPSVDTDTLTPQIQGTFSDPDGNAPSRAQVEVEQVFPSTDVWLSGELTIAASPWSVTYAGPALAWGTSYRARVRTRDPLGGWSAWSAWREWTPTQPLGPDNLSPRSTATKQQSLTPTLTVGHSAAFTNDELQVYAANDLGSALLWSKPEGTAYAAATSKPYVYAGTALSWGGTYYWRARVRVAGTLSAWSALVPFYVNAEPTMPSGLAARDSASSPAVVSGGVAIVTTLTPLLEAVYGDPDLGPYNDLPSSRTVEVYVRNADGSPGAARGSSTLASPPYTVPMAWTYAGTALVVGTLYLVRWRFTDNAGRVGPWSAYLTIKVTQAPTVTLTAPANGSAITDQTPTLDWLYASAPGKAQAGYRVLVFDRGPAGSSDEVLVHDSGQVASAATAYDVPPGILLNGRVYRWQVTVADTDGLSAVLA